MLHYATTFIGHPLVLPTIAMMVIGLVLFVAARVVSRSLLAPMPVSYTPPRETKWLGKVE
jgi:hypothetical protein